jgi:hypothetical protein
MLRNSFSKKIGEIAQISFYGKLIVGLVISYEDAPVKEIDAINALILR